MAGKLNTAELNRIETRLSALYDELRREIEDEKREVVSFTRSQAEEFTTQNQADVSGDMFLGERALGTQQMLEAELAVVEQALKRLTAGTYGLCIDCGDAIPVERLLARPQAVRCIDCERRASTSRGWTNEERRDD